MIRYDKTMYAVEVSIRALGAATPETRVIGSCSILAILHQFSSGHLN